MEAIRRFGAIRRVERVGQRFFDGACKVVAVLITDQEPHLPTTNYICKAGYIKQLQQGAHTSQDDKNWWNGEAKSLNQT
jgi:hypothetical protein